MKVLVFADFRSPHAQGWAAGLEGLGIETLRVASLGMQEVSSGGRSRAGRQMALFMPQRTAHRIRTVEALARQPMRSHALASAVAEFRPDIVHALRLPYEGVSALSSLGPRARVVVSTWGQDFVAQAASDPTLRFWARRALPSAAGLIADVPDDIERARDFGLPDVPTAVAAANFGMHEGDSRSVDISRPVLTYTRGIGAHVNHRSFLLAAREIAARAKLPWTFVGIGLAASAEAREMAADPLLESRMTLTERLDIETFRTVLRGSVATCSPATSDGMSISVLTSLAEGCATLVGPLPQYRELAGKSPLVKLMSGVSDRAIVDSIVKLENDLASGVETGLGQPFVPPVYDRARNDVVVPEFYEKVLRRGWE